MRGLLECLKRTFRRIKIFKMSTVSRDAPCGVQILQKLTNCFCPLWQVNRLRLYQGSVLILTYFTYMTYHLTRKPISVVKSVLHQNCSALVPPPDVDPSDDQWCNWAPFNTSDANTLLGTLDSAFLFSYAGAMFVSGMIAERVDLRYFLSLGMIVSAIFCYLFGVGYTYSIHNISYYLLVQAGAGIAQTTGWPGTVAIVGNWFGNTKKGLIFGMWNSHTSLGNILGTLMASAFVEKDWALSFIYPALVMGVVGGVVFLLLPPEPRCVGVAMPGAVDVRESRPSRSDDEDDDQHQVIVGDQAASLRPNRHSANLPQNYMDLAVLGSLFAAIQNAATGNHHEIAAARRLPVFDPASRENGAAVWCDGIEKLAGAAYPSLQKQHEEATESTSLLTPRGSLSHSSKSAVSLSRALSIPGVMEFSLSLFFAKLVSYTFLYWLPLYINTSTHLTPEESGRLSTVFDVGGIVGAIAAGLIADCTGCPGIVCVVFYVTSAPFLLAYQRWGASSYAINVALLVVTGALVNAPYALITTAVSAELGTHSSLAGNSQALATVTAIIDGTGSVGAAIGPMLAGVVSSGGSWSHVFYMLITCNVMALLLLLRIVKSEVVKWRQERRLTSPRVVRIE